MSNVTNTSGMFEETFSTTSNINLLLGIPINMTNVVDSYMMFYKFGVNLQKNIVLDFSTSNFSNNTNSSAMFGYFPTNYATIYVKDAAAQSFIISKNAGFSASNVLIK